MRDRLSGYLDVIEESTGKAGDFVIEQTPLVAQEYRAVMSAHKTAEELSEHSVRKHEQRIRRDPHREIDRLRRQIEQQQRTIDQLRKQLQESRTALKQIIKHQQAVGGVYAGLGSAIRIARQALDSTDETTSSNDTETKT